MSASHLKTGIIFAACISVLICFGVLSSSKAYLLSDDESYKITGPFTHKNLSLYLIQGKDKITVKNLLSLQEAMQQKKVIVYETGEVNQLMIENTSNKEIYIQSGDIVKGGKQDRVLSYDIVLPAKSGKIPISSFCVEQGRWRKRGSESLENFGGSVDQITTRDLKIAVKHKANQSEVWENVSKAQEKLAYNASAPVRSSESGSSLQLTLENKKVQETTNEYINKLSEIIKGKNDVIGCVVAINGELNSADIYSSHLLLNKLWSKLLKASAVEAVAEYQKDKSFAVIKIDAVKKWIDESEKGSASTKGITKRINLETKETENSLLFETRDADQRGAWIHKNYLRK